MKLFSLALTLIATSVLAAPKNLPAPQAVTTTAPTRTALNSNPWELNLSTGLTTAQSGAQPGVQAALVKKLENTNLYLGGEVGLFAYTDNFGIFAPILATAQTQVDLSNKLDLTLGISAGIGIVQHDSTATFGNTVLTVKDNNIYFAMSFNPGIRLQADENTEITFQTRMGTMNGAFLFSPLIGTVFYL